MNIDKNDNPRMDCPMCGHVDGSPFYASQICGHCEKDLYDTEWENHSSYTTEEGDKD
jgi:hypothetical protein